MAKVAGVIFDVDGTLAETEEAHRRAFNETFEHFKVQWFWDQHTYKRLLGVTGGKERIKFYANEVRTPLSDTDIAELHEYKTKRYEQLIAEGQISLRPGVERLINEALESRVKLLVATTTNYPNVVALLDATLGSGSIDLFDVVAAGDVVPRKKPSPDVYFKALQEVSLDPKECFAIEDSRNGLIAAVSAGISTVITPSSYTADERFSEAISVVDHLGTPDRPCTGIQGIFPKNGIVSISWLSEIIV